MYKPCDFICVVSYSLTIKYAWNKTYTPWRSFCCTGGVSGDVWNLGKVAVVHSRSTLLGLLITVTCNGINIYHIATFCLGWGGGGGLGIKWNKYTFCIKNFTSTMSDSGWEVEHCTLMIPRTASWLCRLELLADLQYDCNFKLTSQKVAIFLSSFFFSSLTKLMLLHLSGMIICQILLRSMCSLW